MEQKTYTTASNARRALKTKGLALEKYEISAGEDGLYRATLIAPKKVAKVEEKDPKQPPTPSFRPSTSIIASPTKAVWHIITELENTAGFEFSRKNVIEECVRRGVAYGTARTQYQYWFSISKKSTSSR